MKLLNIVLVWATVLLVGMPVVHAHVLETSGSVGAVLHVSPDDDPIAGQPTEFFFEFKDKEGKFTPLSCDCTVSIIQAGQEISSQPLFQNNADPSLTNASFSFTFPERDIYQVEVSGTPVQPEAFQPFTLTYDLRVARQSDATAVSDPLPTTAADTPQYTIHSIAIGILLVVIVGAFIRARTKARTP